MNISKIIDLQSLNFKKSNMSTLYFDVPSLANLSYYYLDFHLNMFSYFKCTKIHSARIHSEVIRAYYYHSVFNFIEKIFLQNYSKNYAFLH